MRFCAVTLGLVFLIGGSLVVASGVSAQTEATKDARVVLCGKCGELKGSELCCKADMKLCEQCGLHLDSPGCCKIKKGDDVVLCSKCGEIKGSENCCKEGIELCPKCKLHKDSPGCCHLASQKSALGGCCMKDKAKAGCAKGSVSSNAGEANLPADCIFKHAKEQDSETTTATE